VSVAYVFASARYGRRSNDRLLDSPSTPRLWPSKMRAALIVEMPMPSPTNRMTFLARPVLGRRASA
jgi:hypothetical protein